MLTCLVFSSSRFECGCLPACDLLPVSSSAFIFLWASDITEVRNMALFSPYTVNSLYSGKQSITFICNACFSRWKSFLLADPIVFLFQANPNEIPRCEKLSVIL